MVIVLIFAVAAAMGAAHDYPYTGPHHAPGFSVLVSAE